MGNRVIIRDEGEGRISVYLRRAGHEFPERAGDSFPFTFSMDDKARDDLRWYLEDYLIAPYAVWEDRGQAIADRLDGWGEALFGAVFGSRDTQPAYIKAREGNGGTELVIHSPSPSFLGLPWELLKDPRRPTPLALDPDFVAIDRTFEVEGMATEVPPGETLRVLMVIARPAGIEDVGYQMIARPLLERLEFVRGRVDLEVLRPATVDALEARLKRAAENGRPYHVLHFDGHGVLRRTVGGSFAPRTTPRDRFHHGGEGFVVFEKDTGGDEPVAADHFARIVRTGRVPLVVLNACQSGAMAEVAEATVATRLLLEGAASVVAMGYSVYAVAAAEFMTAFYQALFEGKTVSTAVDAGRDRLSRRSDRPSPKGPLPLQDWIIPVHYLRRAIAFPQLKSTPAPTGLSLDGALDRLRQATKSETTAGDTQVQPEGSIEPVGRFVGRDSFLYTLEVATRHDRVILVHGPGGTGKTELAKAFGRWLRDTGGLDDSGYVFFHSFEPGLPSFGLDGVVNGLGIRLFGPDFMGRTENAEQRRSIMLETLRQHRMLLIWDNFESVFAMPDPGGATPPLSAGQRQEIAGFIAALRGGGSRSSLLLTSRTVEEWLGEVRRIELGGLTPQEAAEYADDLLAPYARARGRREVKAFGELMAWLAGHPLSLRLVLPHLEENTAEALLAGLKGIGALPEGFEAGTGRLQSLEASVKYSLDHLPEYVRSLLPALSLFEGVIDAIVLGTFSAEAGVPTRFAGVNAGAWHTVLQETVRVGLLTQLWRGQYNLQPALPTYLAAQWQQQAGRHFEAEYKLARRALLKAYAGFGAWLSEQIQRGSAETAMALIELQRRTMGEVLAFALREKMFDEAYAVLRPLNSFLDTHGLAEEARSWVDRIRESTEGMATKPPDLGSAAGALWLFVLGTEADRARDRGDLDGAQRAYDDIRRTLELSPQSSPPDRSPDLSVLYHQLGRVAQDRADLVAAEEWYGKSLAIKEALGDDQGMARSYHQLGMLAQDRGDLVSADNWYNKSLAIKEAHGDRPGLSASYQELGRVSQKGGDLAAAAEWYGKSLAINQALGDRPGMAMIYHNLGTVAQYRGDLSGAEQWYIKSLEINEALGHRPRIAMNYGALGSLAATHGDKATALDWMIRSNALFDDFPHPLAGSAPRNLAILTGALGTSALEESWNRCTGQSLPANVRSGVERTIRELASSQA